jgi:hypothetical protein
MGHEDQFASHPPSVGYLFGQETVTGATPDGRSAPKPAGRLSWVERVKPT